MAETAAPTAQSASTEAAPVQAEAPKVDAPKDVKPADPIEAEIAEKFGEEWKTLPDSMKSKVLSAEKKSRDADKKYQQIARIQKAYELTTKQTAQLVNQLKSDPLAVLRNPEIGVDVRQLAEKFLWEQIQQERMKTESPDKWEAEQYKRELEQIRQAQESEKKQKEKEALERHTAERRQQLEKLIVETAQKEKLPANPAVISRMAYYIKLYRSNGHQLSPEVMGEISGRVRQDFKLWSKEFFEQDPDEKLLEDLDGPLIERLRKADLQRLKAKGLKVGDEKSDPSPKPTKKMTDIEWALEREKRLGRK